MSGKGVSAKLVWMPQHNALNNTFLLAPNADPETQHETALQTDWAGGGVWERSLPLEIF